MHSLQLHCCLCPQNIFQLISYCLLQARSHHFLLLFVISIWFHAVALRLWSHLVEGVSTKCSACSTAAFCAGFANPATPTPAFGTGATPGNAFGSPGGGFGFPASPGAAFGTPSTPGAVFGAPATPGGFSSNAQMGSPGFGAAATPGASSAFGGAASGKSVYISNIQIISK